MDIRKSPLSGWHCAHGAKMVEFAGWELPLQYSSVMAEHLAVRSAAGIFDVSHMAQVEVSGSRAEEWLQGLLTNDVAIPPGRAVYSPMCNETGGVIDDVFVFRLDTSRFFLVMNAAREDVDLAWLQARSVPDVVCSARVDRGGLALQGPLAEAILAVVSAEAARLQRNRLAEIQIGAYSAIVSRTGYTGEDGFEVFTDGGALVPVWKLIWIAGERMGLAAAGLGARDTLRLEMGFPLYGRELDEHTSPYEAGYGWAVRLNKPVPFIGQEELRQEKLRGGRSRLACLVLDGRGIARENASVFCGGDRVGQVTSGTFSPTLERAICLARVRPDAGPPFSVDIRGRRLAAQEVSKPFYKRAASVPL